MPMAELIERLAVRLQQIGWRVACAESCTGGLIAGVLTDLAGSSAWFDRGFVTYSNAAKQEMLGVPAEIIARHGAVSVETVSAMAAGALAQSDAQLTVAVSGIAGPSGGSLEKPVGTVYLAWATDDQVTSMHRLFAGDRAEIRAATVSAAVEGLLECVGDR